MRGRNLENNQGTRGAQAVNIIGCGGHARVVRDALLPYPSIFIPEGIEPVGLIAIGIGDIKLRRELFEKYGAITIIHPKAVVSPSASIGNGAQIIAGAVIQSNAVIGRNTIVNTNASVDHDCVIGAHCHIAPGVTLCGSVVIGDGCFIGAGTTIVQGVSLDAGTFVHAGSLVVKQDDIRRPVSLVSGER